MVKICGTPIEKGGLHWLCGQFPLFILKRDWTLYTIDFSPSVYCTEAFLVLYYCNSSGRSTNCSVMSLNTFTICLCFLFFILIRLKERFFVLVYDLSLLLKLNTYNYYCIARELWYNYVNLVTVNVWMCRLSWATCAYEVFVNDTSAHFVWHVTHIYLKFVIK